MIVGPILAPNVRLTMVVTVRGAILNTVVAMVVLQIFGVGFDAVLVVSAAVYR